MSSIFGNYDNALSSLDDAQGAKNRAVQALASTKAHSDDMAKTVGETKLTVGVHGVMSQFRTGFKKVAEAKLKEAVETAKNKAANIGKQALSGDAEDALEGPSMGTPEEILARGAGRLAKFNNSQQEVEEGADWLQDEDGANAIKTTGKFQDSDMGEEGENAYSTETGLTDAEQAAATRVGGGVANDLTTTSEVTEDSLNAARSGVGAGLSDTLNAARTTATGVLKETGEKLGGDVVKEGVGEGIAGGLDAIPGADILGVIAGAVMAGVMGHKEHKEEQAELKGGGSVGFSTTSQVGSFGD